MTCYREAQVEPITLTTTLFCSSVAQSNDSVTVSRNAKCQDPETEAAKWNSAVVITYS